MQVRHFHRLSHLLLGLSWVNNGSPAWASLQLLVAIDQSMPTGVARMSGLGGKADLNFERLDFRF